MHRKISPKHLPLLLCLLLCLAMSLLCWGCGESPSQPESAPQAETSRQEEAAPIDAASPSEDDPKEAPEDAPEQSPSEPEPAAMELDPKTGLDKYQTEAVPEGKPLPVEPQEAAISDTARSCTLEIRCDTILENMEELNPEKAELIPADGLILPATTLTFYEGESVFDLLQRACKQAGIHMEAVNTPVYNSAYIEGIHNLYEFDCGPLSGWMYEVNSWFPNYGCSRYQLQEGDAVIWRFTCDLGRDLGADLAAQQGQTADSPE